MIADIRTVMWKEWKGLFRQPGSRIRLVFVTVVPTVMLGIVLPLQIGEGFLTGYWPLITSVLIPLLVAGSLIPESFAGERERHTLGTLLASRLPDRAILFGKVAMAVGSAWGAGLFTLLVSLITVNIAHWDGQVTLFPAPIALAVASTGLTLPILMAAVGVLISLRASTVQGATQTLMAATFGPLVLLQVVFLVLTSMGRGALDSVSDVLDSVNPTHIVLIVVAIVVVASVIAFAAAMARFRRGRLLLD
jgi:ABC-2 type transport system permease protein